MQRRGVEVERLLCLDGPINGQYAEKREAVRKGYVRIFWPNGEACWQYLHAVGESPATDFHVVGK